MNDEKGMQIALGADFRFAAPDCKLSIMEAKWGLIPDMSASVTLRELVRADIAKELTMTGRVIDGKEAAELGLVTRCVDDPMAEAQKLAMEIVARYVQQKKMYVNLLTQSLSSRLRGTELSINYIQTFMIKFSIALYPFPQ